MSEAVRTPPARHQDVLVASVSSLPIRDDREAMPIPLVSLSKGKRTRPIHWRSADNEQHVTVTANAEHGMATIWDMDVLVWAVSQLNAAVEEQRPTSPTLSFHPRDLLAMIQRGNGGRDYLELESALRRLAGTVVETNIRRTGRKSVSQFHLLESWQHEEEQDTGKSLGMTLTLPRWLFDGVVKQRDVLAIPPSYFEISSGIGRFLYRLARRHGGKQVGGWRFTMKRLHERSGSVQPLKEFARAVRSAVRVGIPEYRLDLIRGETGEEVLSMIRDPKRVQQARSKTLQWTMLPSARPVKAHGVSPAD